MRALRLSPLVPLLLLVGCAPLNYTHPTDPSVVACCVARPPAAPDSLSIVSYNIRFADDVPGALRVLASRPELATPDVLLLQEMDEPGVARVARAMNLNVVYYPAVLHPKHDKDFGNAVLSRWPIVRHKKVILPHQGRFGRTQRIGVFAVLDVAGTEVTVASVHLATPIENGPEQRKEQADRVADVATASRTPLTIVAGDLNDPALVTRFVDRGFACPTYRIGGTSVNGFSLDHLFVRRNDAQRPDDLDGAAAALADGRAPTGVVYPEPTPSDHFPIWGKVALAPPPVDAR